MKSIKELKVSIEPLNNKFMLLLIDIDNKIFKSAIINDDLLSIEELSDVLGVKMQDIYINKEEYYIHDGDIILLELYMNIKNNKFKKIKIVIMEDTELNHPHSVIFLDDEDKEINGDTIHGDFINMDDIYYYLKPNKRVFANRDDIANNMFKNGASLFLEI